MASTRRTCWSSRSGQLWVPAEVGNGGANVFWETVEEEVKDIDPESGTGTDVCVLLDELPEWSPAQ